MRIKNQRVKSETTQIYSDTRNICKYINTLMLQY